MPPNAAAVPLPIHPVPAKTTGRGDAEDRSPPQQPPATTTRPLRPNNNRSVTDPSPRPTHSLQGYFKDKDQWTPRPSSSHRNRSPYSRSHLRSRSSGAVGPLPLMTRAHSMPSPMIPRSATDTPSSPMRPPVRTRSPFTEEAGGIESIQEDSELDLRPRSQQSTYMQPTALRVARVSSGGRRRPASPLSNPPFSQPPPTHQAPTSFPLDAFHSTAATPPTATSASSSPSLAPQRERYINEAYPTSLPPNAHTLHHHSSTSSMASFTSLASHNSSLSLYSYPSTPTSARSRSPSISSLDTIEDEPEMEVMEQLKEDAIAEEEGEDGGGRRRSLDGGERRQVGFGFGSARGRSERKRWSVCGGERRADLDLETIWED